MIMQYDKSSYLHLNGQPLAGTTVSNLIRVMGENQFRISWQLIPKALYITLLVLGLTPLRFKENMFCKNHCKKIHVDSPIFIIGHWRSGTTFLHYLLGKDPSLAYVSTLQTLAPHLFLTKEIFLKSYLKNNLPSKRPMDNLELEADLPYEDEYALANNNPYSMYHGWYFPKNLVKYFRKYVLFDNVPSSVVEKWKNDYIKFLKKITYKNPNKRIVLKSLVNTAKIKQILKIFPDAKFIHIYRNPYDVYKSTWKLYASILPLFSFQHISKNELDEAILTIYHEMYKRYLEEKTLISSGNLFEISYETFIHDPLSNLKRIYDFLDLDSFDDAKPHFIQYITYHRNYQKNQYLLNINEKKKVADKWGFTFDAFGYTP